MSWHRVVHDPEASDMPEKFYFTDYLVAIITSLPSLG
jgi:hypothetical protein